MTAAFFHGLFLAIGLILPLGVQNLFVFQQGMMQPKLRGAMPVIVTAALCDTLLILLAVGGMSIFLIEFAWVKEALLGIGIVFLLYMWAATWKKSGDIPQQRAEYFSPKRQILFALSVSLLNPYVFLDIVGVIGTSSLHYADGEKAVYTAVCIAVSWCWFLWLGIVGRYLGTRDGLAGKMRLINRISSIFIWGTAVFFGEDTHRRMVKDCYKGCKNMVSSIGSVFYSMCEIMKNGGEGR